MKKNILHISRTMGQGGAERVVFNLAKDTRDEFDQCFIASTGGEMLHDLKKFNVNSVTIPDLNSKRIIDCIKIFNILRRVIQDEGINIIHSHHRMAAFYTRILKILYPNLELIYTAHNIFNDKKKLYRFSLRKTKIIAVGASVKMNLTDYIGISKENVKVIYNSVSSANEEKIDLNVTSKKGIGCIARLSEQKGVSYLLESFKDVVDTVNNVHLYIIGTGDLDVDLKEFVNTNNLKEFVTFLGYQKNAQSLINNFEFIVLPSLWEGFPLTPIETFMEGKTIVATDIDGTNEIVKNMHNGLLVKKADQHALSEAIILLLQNEDLRKRLSTNAKRDYEKYFSYENFVNEYMNVYRD